MCGRALHKVWEFSNFPWERFCSKYVLTIKRTIFGTAGFCFLIPFRVLFSNPFVSFAGHRKLRINKRRWQSKFFIPTSLKNPFVSYHCWSLAYLYKQFLLVVYKLLLNSLANFGLAVANTNDNAKTIKYMNITIQ